MDRKIYKFPARREGDELVVDLPADAEPLAQGDQDGARQVWASVGVREDGSVASTESVRFAVGTIKAVAPLTLKGTGGTRPEGEHVATYFEGPFVWHLFATP